ncbi:MAG: type III-B CRISPR-associated protein Cas10/Cmr2 [Myxococcota bacterium]
MSTPHLILWTCGPVQSFIAAARKGRDLWFGSWLLSEVSTAAANAFLESGARLLLPAPPEPVVENLARLDFDVPNRVLVQVSTDNPRALAEHVSEKASQQLRTMATKTFDTLEEQGHRNQYDREEAIQQIEDLLDTAWASVRCTERPQRDRSRVVALLEARRSARLFTPPLFAQPGVPKSSLDGAREVVTRKGAGLRLGLTHDERLCGVGLLKRMGHHIAKDAPGGRLASVSAFALHTWLRPALGPHQEHLEAVENAVKAFADELRRSQFFTKLEQPRAFPLLGQLDAHAFYANRVHEFAQEDKQERDKQDEGPQHKDGLNDLRTHHTRALNTFLDTVARDTNVRLPRVPNPYYAILLGDGDQLGRYLRPLDHQELAQVSGVLSAFAASVRDDVFRPERLAGACVYAGGDDVLALVPVDVALQQARALSDRFAAAFEELGESLLARHGVPTFSVGICVAHHLTPLRDALAGARAAEATAKEIAGRCAWAVRVNKRSGAPITIHGPWTDDSDRALIRLTTLSAAGGDVPRGLAHELVEVARRLGVATEVLERCELIRVLAQKGDAVQQHRDFFLGELERARSHHGNHTSGLANLAERLVVARALAGLGGAAA